MKQLTFIIFSLLLNLCAHAQNANEEIYAETLLSSNQLVPGEQANLQIHIIGARPDSRPLAPEIPNTEIHFINHQSQLINTGQRISVLNYSLSSTTLGVYTIPAMTLIAGGKTLETQPLNYQVNDISTLQKVPTGIEGINILARWIPDKETLYPGQQNPVSLKLYAPKILNAVSWGILEPSKENCLAWRFASSSGGNGDVLIDGEAYTTEILSSTLSGISPGTASLNAANLQVTIRQVVLNSRNRRQIRDYALDLVIPDLDLKIIPFPAGAPDDFNGAVGNFEIRSHSEKPSFLSNEPTEVILQVGGIGNLESLKAPVLGESPYPDLSWKTINTAKDARGKERREITGVVTFRQLIRPEVKNKAVLDQPNLSIPPYSFSFFNPATKLYKTLTTEPIPVEITAAEEDPLTEEERNSIPEEIKPEKMTDILDVIANPDEANALSQNKGSRYLLWNILPAALSLFIISLPLLKKLRRRFSKTQDKKDQQKELREISKQSANTDFYAASGRYISRWLADNDHPDLQTIIRKRDEICFQPESNSESVSGKNISTDRKQAILDLLKKLSIVIISMGIFLSDSSVSAAEDQTPLSYYSNGQYQKAIDLYQQSYPSSANSIYGTPADVFYNIGNCYQKTSESGKAALAWRRALAVDPTHTEARKNLRFIEKETLAYNESPKPWQNKLTKYQPTTYKLIFQISLWIFVLSLLSILCLRSTAWVRAATGVLIILLIISPFTAVFGYTAAYLYPDTDLHTDYSEQAVVTTQASLYQQARRKDDNFQVITPATLLKVIAVRDSWSRVQVIQQKDTSSPQEGWLKTDLIEFITTK
ncbi:BatD family protein [Akkermansiaceae bacterium]|nr:BatD family protein [Akkermansiaceae bacterium]